MAEPTSQRNPVTVALIAAIAALGVTGVGLGVLANNGFFSPASAAPVPEASASPGSSGTSGTTGTNPTSSPTPSEDPSVDPTGTPTPGEPSATQEPQAPTAGQTPAPERTSAPEEPATPDPSGVPGVGDPGYVPAEGTWKEEWVYEVSDGDTLAEISRETGVSVDTHASANGISNNDLIYRGYTIRIPATMTEPAH